ncbi:MAG: hypothetical protein ACRC4P_10580 [Aeromonas sp.]
MNRSATLLLSLLLVSTAPFATPQPQVDKGSEFSTDQITFNLDWDDQQFGWSQSDCLDLGAGTPLPTACSHKTRFYLKEEDNRNQPPSTNQLATPQGNNQ